MKKTILITGATDGLGLATAKSLAKQGHLVLIHGRDNNKLNRAKQQLSELTSSDNIQTYQADLSILSEVNELAKNIIQAHQKLDVLINNAGVFIMSDTLSKDGLDVRFMVNTIAPYMLTQKLLPILSDTGRVINLSSAAQSSLNPEELLKPSTFPDNLVYAKSKLALTMWSRHLAMTLQNQSQIIVAVNPKSFLSTKMVNQAYGVVGHDLQMGADIIVKAALSETFSQASGLYFDNDIGQFTSPHPDALNPDKIAKLSQAIELIINDV